MMLMMRMFSLTPGMPGTQTAVAAHDQVDDDAGLARFVELAARSPGLPAPFILATIFPPPG
jgi:hypothetical protein